MLAVTAEPEVSPGQTCPMVCMVRSSKVIVDNHQRVSSCFNTFEQAIWALALREWL